MQHCYEQLKSATIKAFAVLICIMQITLQTLRLAMIHFLSPSSLHYRNRNIYPARTVLWE